MFTNWLAPPTNAPPPDIVLEVGPPPYARYAAHSALLSAHSGYLRSAIRPDDRNFDSPIYLPNITSEQFAPLLTYMYTGFLDLSIENIFAVLLATHVLHMPRASEICRAFLARTQSEGYLGGSFLSGVTAPPPPPAHLLEINTSEKTNNVKIIRPIASKASGTNLGFIAPPVSTILLPSRDTQFKCLQSLELREQREQRSPVPSTSKAHNSSPSSSSSPRDSIIVSSVIKPNAISISPSNNQITAGTIKKSQRTSTAISTPSTTKRSNTNADDRHLYKKINCDIVEDPIKLDGSNKIIIDIASCDGPVRFRRVLNEAYGRVANPNVTTKMIERSHQHVATSFHLQMAKAMNEQRLQQQQNSEESENSQEINVSCIVPDSPAPIVPPSSQSLPPTSDASLHTKTTNDEVYSCVYCKHTFKSQYCYQKHAKRHINPLTIDDSDLIVETIDSGSEKDEKGSSSGGGGVGSGVSSIRREVRPLDMNVQYYPCKTCGSKFPSYYFVHKHRKLCHSNEEN